MNEDLTFEQTNREIKALNVPQHSLHTAFDEFMSAFEAFKQANDERLEQIERKLSADVLTQEKVERINRAVDEQKRIVDELTLGSRRPTREDAHNPLLSRGEHAMAWEDYVRKGETARLCAFETRALSGGTGDGGYLVPEEIEARVGRSLALVSPVRSVASVRQVSSNTYKKIHTKTAAGASWVAETGSRSQSTDPDLEEMSFAVHELYAMPAVSMALLEDGAFDVEQWLVDEVRLAFADKEDDAFINGNGTNKPKGILAETTVADASWQWKKLGYIATGRSANFHASNPNKALFDLMYALKSGYRGNAHWLLNRKTQAEVRKMKDSGGQYLWQPGAKAGQAATIANFPVVESEHMPNMAANTFSVAFGDFRQGFVIADRTGMRVLRDPYSSKPYVLFYITKRLGAGVQNFEAIKLLKFGTS